MRRLGSTWHQPIPGRQPTIPGQTRWAISSTISSDLPTATHSMAINHNNHTIRHKSLLQCLVWVSISLRRSDSTSNRRTADSSSATSSGKMSTESAQRFWPSSIPADRTDTCCSQVDVPSLQKHLENIAYSDVRLDDVRNMSDDDFFDQHMAKCFQR